MAVMCPETPREFHPASLEGMMFQALSALPDSYYVFHSFTVIHTDDEGLSECEVDFVIFHPEKGVLCIEAKAGNVQYQNGEWLYGDGTPMRHGGPFRQASTNMHNLMDYIDDCGYDYIRKKCKFMFAVWFPSVTEEQFRNVVLPADADRSLILFRDSIEQISDEIARIFSIPLRQHNVQTMLGARDKTLLLERIFAPRFEIISITTMEHTHKKLVFKTLLKEQTALLNYLEEQNCAVINGMAGTGKTLIALEKARRHAAKGESVLFLCYNKKLKEHLRTCYPHDFIEYHTIDGLACKLCNTPSADYQLFQEKLEDYYLDGGFPYQHVIIDEGQDFGQEKLDEITIVELLQSIITEHEEANGTFYVFYDKNQLVQGSRIPACIANAECRLTLYRNCRNTENIAIASMRLLGSERQPKLFADAVIGDTPLLFMEEAAKKQAAAVQQCIRQFEQSGCESIVILTVKTEETGLLHADAAQGMYLYQGRKYLYTTCRKFKGLEADAVILTDIEGNMDADEIRKLIYVGASRARFHLALITGLREADCCGLLDRMELKHTRQPKKALATAFNAKLAAIQDAVTV
ncbi:MAG: ATP-binding domain-containing protein [Oscillospiraceae bacterium]|nr:ATP-binding domain-containing protein [Oscillospiraceae bacterium]